MGILPEGRKVAGLPDMEDPLNATNRIQGLQKGEAYQEEVGLIELVGELIKTRGAPSNYLLDRGGKLMKGERNLEDVCSPWERRDRPGRKQAKTDLSGIKETPESTGQKHPL